MAIVPSRDEIARFHDPVPSSVMEVVDLYERFFAAHPTFGPNDLFVRPFLANYLPDLVVSTPRGLLVLEVFEGNVDTVEATNGLKAARDRAAFLA